MAKKAIDLSTFDQENLRMKVEEWERGNLKSSFYFGPYGKKAAENESSEEQTFLYVHQEEWQK